MTQCLPLEPTWSPTLPDVTLNSDKKKQQKGKITNDQQKLEQLITFRFLIIYLHNTNSASSREAQSNLKISFGKYSEFQKDFSRPKKTTFAISTTFPGFCGNFALRIKS